MSTAYGRPPIAELPHELPTPRGNRLWFGLLGVARVCRG